MRELDLTFERARTLIDAGFPFVLTTARTTSSHAQVVIGYDIAREGLLVRDPSCYSLVEVPSSALDEQAWNGPHAMVLAPPSRADTLTSLDLGPECALLEQRQALSLALERHDLDAATDLARALERDGGTDSRHALCGALQLARYQGRSDDALALLDRLLALHPDTPTWILERAETMRGRRSRGERLEFLGTYAHLDDSALLEVLAEELRCEEAQHAEARRLLRRTLRLDPRSGMAHHVLADLRVGRGEDAEEILESYRFAACLTPGHEHFARAYFDHARACGRDDEALRFLERRAAEAEQRAREPAQTLYGVYLDAGNPERGVAALTKLADARPDDGDLAVLLVAAHLDAGDPAGAVRWLEHATERAAREADRLVAAARIARVDGDLPRAREALERACELEPARVDRLAGLTDLLLELEGIDSVVARVERAFADHPHDGAILAELCVWLRGRDEERAEEVLRARVAAHEDDTWRGASSRWCRPSSVTSSLRS